MEPIGIAVVLGKIVAAIVVCRIAWQLWWNRPGADGRDIPGDMGWPTVGESLSFFWEKPRCYLRRRHTRYGPIFKSHILGRPHVFLESANDIRSCLLGENRIVRSKMPKPLRDLCGQDTMLCTHGDLHDQQRYLLLRCLNPASLQTLLSTIQPRIEDLVRSWADQGLADHVDKDVAGIVFRVAQTLVLGECDERLSRIIEPLFVTVERGCISMPLDLPFTEYGKACAARKDLRTIFRAEIDRRERQFQETGIKGDKGYLDVLLNNRRKNGETDDGSREKLLSEMFLGFSAPTLTTMSAIVQVLNRLANEHDLIERLYEEQIEIIASGETLPPIAIEQLKAMTLLESVTREVLRLSPISMLLPRIAIRSFTTDQGHTIPAGWNVWLSIDSNMTNGSVLPNPGEFMPERFLKTTDRRYQPSTWDLIFFGGGCRRCPGNELAMLLLKMFVTIVIRNGRFRYADGVQMTIVDKPVPLPSEQTPMNFIYTARI